jgi:hypothetical protein
MANLTAEPGPVAVTSGDFNGDGIVDLAAVNQGNNTISVFLGTPECGFSAQTSYATGSDPTAIVAGDFNGDGNLDIAVASANCTIDEFGPYCVNAGSISILLGNGDGTFQSHVDYGVGTYPTAVAAAGFSGDVKLDLAVSNTNDNTVSVLLGTGEGTFRPQVVYTVAETVQAIRAQSRVFTAQR